ncbi:hypothetical protein GGD46_002841 [Rhizobium lusitanum]|uniref:Periplasmic protein-like protein n=1 Tax=Rhizobium lusitanum TaxID=293958 RepID=A0A7X0IR02_9HYPH|nr:hypothetical protein [Rhizobium lusitanum]
MIPIVFSHLSRRIARICRLGAAAGLGLLALTTAAAAQVPGAPMQFMLVHADPSSGDCRPDGCMDWIAAEGMIDARSPTDLRKLLASIGNRKLPIIVNSPGGNVEAAMEMGEIIRKRGLSVAVGGTRLQSCPNNQPLCADGWRGGSKGVVYSAGSRCFSACPFVLAAGVRRVVSPFSIVGVHQVKTTYDQERIIYRMKYQIVNGKKRLVSRREISRKFVGQHDSTKLSKSQRSRFLAYFKEMGIDRSILDMAMSAAPSSIRLITPDEAMKIGLRTDQASADDLIKAGSCATGQPFSACQAPVSTDLAAVFANPPFADWQLNPVQDFLAPDIAPNTSRSQQGGACVPRSADYSPHWVSSMVISSDNSAIRCRSSDSVPSSTSPSPKQ